MGSWGTQRTLRGSDGSWQFLRGPRSTQEVFRGPKSVLRGSRGVLTGPVGLMGTERYWGIKGFARSPRFPEGSKGFREVLKGHMGLWWTFNEISSPLKHSNISRILRALQDPSNPTGFLRTPWTSGPPSNIRTPQDHVRTMSGPRQDRFRNSEYPLSTHWTPQNPSGPIRTP